MAPAPTQLRQSSCWVSVSSANSQEVAWLTSESWEQVRILLDEQEANLFSDAEINREINKGAVHASRATQCLQFPFQKLTEADKAEYGCIAQTTDIIRVAYSDGSTTYDLKRMRAPKLG